MIYNIRSDSLPCIQTLRHSWKFLCKIAPSVGLCHFYRQSTSPSKIQLYQWKSFIITNIYHKYQEESSVIKAIIMINKILSWIQTFPENWTLDTNVPNADIIYRNASFYVFVLQPGVSVTFLKKEMYVPVILQKSGVNCKCFGSGGGGAKTDDRFRSMFHPFVSNIIEKCVIHTLGSTTKKSIHEKLIHFFSKHGHRLSTF
jgi:hypothetical protein